MWNTHWHPDHTGGNAGVREAHGATVIAPAAEAAKIPTADRLASEGDVLTLRSSNQVIGAARGTIADALGRAGGDVEHAADLLFKAAQARAVCSVGTRRASPRWVTHP